MPGICAACGYHRWVEVRRGSSFLWCGKSALDPRFPKYPPLPVHDCTGFTPEAKEDPTGPSEEGSF